MFNQPHRIFGRAVKCGNYCVKSNVRKSHESVRNANSRASVSHTESESLGIKARKLSLSKLSQQFSARERMEVIFNVTGCLV